MTEPAAARPSRIPELPRDQRVAKGDGRSAGSAGEGLELVLPGGRVVCHLEQPADYQRGGHGEVGDELDGSATAYNSYDADGQLETMSAKNGAGTVVFCVSRGVAHDLSYQDAAEFYLNGNQASDAFKRSSPTAGAPCSAATCTESYTYDARDRVVEHRNGASGITNYTLDPASNVTQEKLASSAGGFVRDFTFKGNEHLDHVTPRSQGGDLSPENLTPACSWCNLSKGARMAPVNPPAGYVGEWPPSFWPSRMQDWWNTTYSGAP